ncbi:hypothetical protein M3Y99_01307700 [Aphelenchoides fujianensis]|nr:hypothetical protein M3Y99_01916300 [Aphelenchoides fujianensis]KAI6223026.1 hypothetical protein M3Y99_01472100 [Aphelenchoides fujianensis]KAI6226289.1 hypothetical protein M3Y99_01307700 [Aphelenchoides fujianensis]
MSLFASASHHFISPMARTRSRSLSSSSFGASALRRANSYTATSSGGGFTRPSYGYGGGYMARSLSRTGSMFGRSLSATALDKTPPFSNIGVARSTPHYSDKYPYVRYSYGNTDTALSILTQTELKNPSIYGIKDTGTKRWLEGRVNLYNTTLFTRPDTTKRVERPLAPTRSYVRYMGVDDAMDLYKSKHMTVGTLSKYWLSPTTAYTRREKDLNVNVKMSTNDYNSYNTRFANRPAYYSKVAHGLRY